MHDSNMNTLVLEIASECNLVGRYLDIIISSFPAVQNSIRCV